MVDVSRWLAERGLGAADLTEVCVEQFLTEWRASGRLRLHSSRGLCPLLEYLRELGVVPAPVVVTPLTVAGQLVEPYSAYLFERRGLSPSTVRNYVGVARVFFSWREEIVGTLALEGLDGAAVIGFVLGESQRCSVGSAKCMVTRLRALLRFLHLEGEIDHDLAGVVPSVASWRLAGLVKALDSRSVGRLLACCDRRTRVGRRDFTVITFLSRLGLRACELAALRPSDIDWRAGELLFAGKAAVRNVCRCPLMSARRWRAG